MPAIKNRRSITEDEVEKALTVFVKGLHARIKKHGNGSFASSHEILGIITEEYDELKDAVRANDRDAIIHELLDIAVPAVFAVACLKTGEVEVL